MGMVNFSLAEMENLYGEAKTCQTAYNDAKNSVKSDVIALSNIWVSNETGTYEEFKAKFDSKLPTLEEANTLMEQFCKKIEEKRSDYQDAANRTINRFQ